MECLVPVFFFYTFGTFNLDWIPLENALIAYFIVALCYFRIVQVTDKAFIFWMGITGYLLYGAIYG